MASNVKIKENMELRDTLKYIYGNVFKERAVLAPRISPYAQQEKLLTNIGNRDLNGWKVKITAVGASPD